MLVVIATSGCGGKPAKDCESFGEQVAELSDPASEAQRQRSAEVSVTACKKGRVSDAELACVAKATTRDELLDCQIPGRHRAPLSVAAADVAPTNRLALAEVLGVEAIDVTTNAAHRTWFEGLQRGVAACSPPAAFTEVREVRIAVLLGTPNHVYSTKLPEELLSCVQKVLLAPAPPSVERAISFRITVGK